MDYGQTAQGALLESEVGLRRAPSDHGDYIREIEQLPARLLPCLPMPLTLWLEVPGAPVPICLTTAVAEGAAEPVLGPRVVFDRDEVAALVIGAEADRVWRRELLGMCFEKWRRPALRIAAADALAGVLPDASEVWSVGRVLHRLGATVVRVELADDAPPRHSIPVAA